MEDMSKKTKRLERENDNLKRKHQEVNGNILKMAEERNKNLGEIEDLKKKLDKLNGIIKQMQQQGRGIPQGMTGPVENGFVGPEGDLEGDESDYEDDYDEGEDEEVSDDGEEYDDETEDEVHHPSQPKPQAYGPERPPSTTAASVHGPATATTVTTANGHR
jgi:hypothetical protein